MAVNIHWWPLQPYTIPTSNHNQVSFHGFFFNMLMSVLKSCGQNISDLEEVRWTNQHEMLSSQLMAPFNPEDAVAYLPISIRSTIEQHIKDLQLPNGTIFISILESPGSVHFYKPHDEMVGSDLVAVILQGWPMLIVIILGAGYSGIIIWLLVSLFFNQILRGKGVVIIYGRGVEFRKSLVLKMCPPLHNRAL